ncbi:MAG: hypothetical protein K0R15_382 [Clostridiales bacterium]|jgi:hypothetical protein|nr:hypothetical protein [Clostridiales bacterium]
MKFLNKMEKTFGRFAIKNLMLYVIVINIIGIFATLIEPNLVNSLYFNPVAFLNGEVWRIFTVAFMPTTEVGLLMGLILYFYYWVGSSIENTIGSFKFNVYYFSGYLLTIIVSLLTSFPVENLGYLNLSIFLAFAALAPNHTVLLFFILPVKMKYLALFDVVLQLYIAVGAIFNKSLAAFPSIRYGLAMTVLVPLINAGIFALLFRSGRGLSKNNKQRRFEKEFRQQMAHNQSKTYEPKHRCTVCGRTEVDDESLEFRFCSKCEGNYEYCSDHLFNHEHK